LKTIFQISTEARELAGLAKAKKLKPEQFSGGTFCVSNLGMMGIERFNSHHQPAQCRDPCGRHNRQETGCERQSDRHWAADVALPFLRPSRRGRCHRRKIPRRAEGIA